MCRVLKQSVAHESGTRQLRFEDCKYPAKARLSEKRKKEFFFLRGEKVDTGKTKNSKPFPKIPADGMLNGAVCASYSRCSKPNCKCARGSLHGPYYHRYQWYEGRVIKEYIPLSQVEEVRAACARYRDLQADIRANNRRFKIMLAMLKMNIKELSI
jgi:hypothetical protein